MPNALPNSQGLNCVNGQLISAMSEIITLSHQNLPSQTLQFTASVTPAIGKERGSVLCLHGFPDNRDSFAKQIQDLSEAGYRVICPSMRGYEPSSQPSNGDYSLAALADDVFAWLDQLGLAQVHLIGHDWGALAGYTAVGRHPERFASFTALAIPPLRGLLPAAFQHPKQFWLSRYIYGFQARKLAEWRNSRENFAQIETYWKAWSPDWDIPAAKIASIKQSFAQPGVMTAALGYYRALFAFASKRWRDSRRTAFKPIQVPSLILHGENDGCMAASLFPDAVHHANFTAGVDWAVLEHCGHFLHQELPQAVNPHILAFLAKL